VPLPRSIRLLVTAILIAMVPWCCCGLGVSSCCAAESTAHAATDDDGLPPCCRHSSSATSCHDEGPSGAVPAKAPAKECGSGCCGPKAPPAAFHLHLATDTVGTPIDFPALETACLPALLSAASRPDPSRPPGASSGRGTLRAHCVLQT
jgi:hypothetical protein